MNDKNILAGRGVAGKVRISKSDRCDVFFFGVALTKKQIGEIGGKLGVKYVVPNQRLQADDYPFGFTSSHPKIKKPPVLTAPGSRFKKRAQILSDPEAFEDLQFISTRQDAELSDAYFYREEAGEGITIIAVDVAENIRHDDEFTTTTGESPFLEQRFYGMGGGFIPDEARPRVTCRLSKMVGSTCGVARKAKVIIAKITCWVDSVLDVWSQIDSFLRRESQLGHEVHGKYVMSIMLQWDLDDPRITSELEGVLDTIIRSHQVVVVVQAGEDPTKTNADIDKWPGVRERRTGLIVVGAMDVSTGRMYPFSKAGQHLTINAPGEVECAIGEEHYTYTTGTRVLNDSINYQDYYQDLTKFNSRWAPSSSYQFKTQLLNLDKIID